MKSSTELWETMGDAEYLKSCLKDPTLYPAFEKQMLSRARRVALVSGAVLIVTLISVVFAFVQDTKLEMALNRKTKLERELKACVQEAQKQQGLASENMMILTEANKLAEEQLQACQAKK